MYIHKSIWNVFLNPWSDWIRFSDWFQFSSWGNVVLPVLHCLIWHACRKLFFCSFWENRATAFNWKMVFQLLWKLYKKVSFTYDLKMHSPIILLQLDLVKQKRLILRAQVGRLRNGCWKDETSWVLLYFSQFETLETDSERGTFSWIVFICLLRPKLSWISSPPLRGYCNTGQWETHLQMRNKEFCFAYQLLTTSWVAFGCCLWFCRCMPSYGSMVTDPFPRKLHWNIFTVTSA